MGSKKFILTMLGIILFFGSADGGIRTLSAHGSVYVPLNNIAPYYSMQLTKSGHNRMRLKNKWHTIDFEMNSRNCWVNGTLLWLNNPVRKIGWQWTIKDNDFKYLIDPAVRPYFFLKTAGSRVVVLDPGHGGHKTGATSPRNVQEKRLVLDVAKRVRNLLQARGVIVRMTREGDQHLTLSERTKKAASWKADLFVSLHADSATKSAEGASTFILALPKTYNTHDYGDGTPSATVHPGNRFNIANTILGYRIQQNMIKSTQQKDRGVKSDRFKVLREAPCPATLVEMAFISNPKEEALVLKASHRAKIARGIANGIAAYINDVKRAK